MRRLISGLLLGVVAMVAAACGSSNTITTPTTTTTTAPAPITEPLFTGTLTANGAATYPFAATFGGTVTATLTALASANASAIGIGIGTWTGSACQIVVANDNAAQAAAISGTVTAAASLCVRVYDVGKVTAPTAFTV
ncbi:MAG: hypothetical protein ABJC51_01465, partial [Acidobacteriota bacterium]